MKRLFKSILVVIAFVICFILIIKSCDFYFGLVEQGIKENSKYTIGTTTELFDRGRGRSIIYMYKIQNQTYRNSIDFKESIKFPNGRYYVRYDSTAWYNSELLQDCPVPDSITEAPANGWVEIPK